MSFASSYLFLQVVFTFLHYSVQVSCVLCSSFAWLRLFEQFSFVSGGLLHNRFVVFAVSARFRLAVGLLRAILEARCHF